MPDRCPRCNRKMDDIAMWRPVNIGDDDPIHVCMDCAKEADLIDKRFAEACAKAKKIWLGDVATILPSPPAQTPARYKVRYRDYP